MVGAESIDGSGGDALGVDVLPTEDLRVVGTEPLPGGSVSYEVFVRGDRVGDGLVTTEMVSADLLGTTVVDDARHRDQALSFDVRRPRSRTGGASSACGADRTGGVVRRFCRTASAVP